MYQKIYTQLEIKYAQLIESMLLFFKFLGELVYIFFKYTSKIKWRKILVDTLSAGTKIVIPLSIISMFLGTGLALGIQNLLARFHLQQQAMIIAQSILLRDFAPLPIGFILCVHCALNLIESSKPNLNVSSKKVLLETIIPLMAGINLTGLLLYTYVFAAFTFSIFLTFYFIQDINTSEYLLRLSGIINPVELIASVEKTIFYVSIASLITGYYYYDISNRVIPIRLAVSRIITRGLFWLVIASVILKLIFN